jgi:hypothetical protein
MGNAMKLFGLKKLLMTGGLCLLALLTLSYSASAQEVTYYNFDAPESTPAQTSYTCPNSGVPSAVFFCFDNVYQQPTSPAYISDTYPANINPGGTNPNYAVQLTMPTTDQSSSMWFSVPQQVSSGFTNYFAFRITPNANSFATADGFAFVIQNSLGGGSVTLTGGATCAGLGAGANIVGGSGGCIGYGGIDNSLAIEFDTYKNLWDPTDNINPNNANDDNHVAIQNCGAGLPNSPDHTAAAACLVQYLVNNAPTGAINSMPGITLADGNVHQVVVNYSGPTEATPNLLQVFIDPAFNPGTYTPVAGSVPVLSGIYNIAGNLNLASGGTTAYVGFTSATGSAFEQHELLAWTYTPHTTVSQEQPLNPPGNPTTFAFGGHTYTVTYPTTGPQTSGINMVVTANTISPSLFATLASAPGSPFAGAQCQVYDGTGGNCIVDSVSCNQGGAPVACPTIPADVTDPTQLIDVLMSFNNSTPLVTPGLLQGDPFYTQISTITGDGTTATVTCTGECSVIVGQSVTVAGSSVTGFDSTATVLTASAPNVFTYASSATASLTSPATGGYVTSLNVQNIIYCDPLCTITPPVDTTVPGKTKNFSDFVVTSVTPAPTTLVIAASPGTYGVADPVIVTATSPNGDPTGSISLTVDSNPTIYTQPLVPSGGPAGSTATFSLTLTGGTHTLNVSYATTGVFLGTTTSIVVSIAQTTPTVTFTGAPTSAAYNSTFPVAATTNASTVASIMPSGVCTILGNTVTITSGSGTCTLTATWAADTNYLGATAIQKVIATKATSTTTAIDTPNPSAIQAPVSVGVSVTGNGTPTGTFTVTSSVPGDPTCTGTLPATSCSLTFLTPGARLLTITYSGDGNFLSSFGTVSQTVSASPLAQVSPSSLNFGTLYQGGWGLQAVTLKNVGDAPMTINEPFLFDVGNGDSKEFVALSLCPKTLPAGNSCEIYVFFYAGPSYNAQTAILKIMDNAPGNPQSVPLTANVIDPQAQFSPGQVGFGSVKVGTPSSTSVQLTNSGGTALTISGFSVKGADPGDFASTSNCPASLNPHASCSITVTFTPAKTGSRTASLYVIDNTQSGSSQLPLSGTGK